MKNIKNVNMLTLNPAFRDTVIPGDREDVRNIALSSGFFRQDEVDVAVELVDEVLAKGEASGYHFIFALIEGRPAGFVCYGSIPCTIGSYDLYWIAVEENYRGRGIGKKLLIRAEEQIGARQGRQIFIETSSTEKYAATRNFYLAAEYLQAARLADFYLPGDDKIIYSKRLS